MKKILTFGIMLMFLIPALSSTGVSNPDDIKIHITAGFFRNKWGNIGLGWNIMVDNNCNHNITGFYVIEYYTLSGELIGSEYADFELLPNCGFGCAAINAIGVPRINRLTITVEADNESVSRSGIEIGPFVVLEI